MNSMIRVVFMAALAVFCSITVLQSGAEDTTEHFAAHLKKKCKSKPDNTRAGPTMILAIYSTGEVLPFMCQDNFQSTDPKWPKDQTQKPPGGLMDDGPPQVFTIQREKIGVDDPDPCIKVKDASGAYNRVCWGSNSTVDDESIEE